MSSVAVAKNQDFFSKHLDCLKYDNKDETPLTTSNVGNKLAIGAAVSSLAFQQSPINELTRVYAAVTTLEATGNPVLSAAAVGAATMFIETTGGVASAYALRRYSNKLREYRDKIASRFFSPVNPQPEYSGKSFFKDTAFALTVGSAAVVARRHFYEENRTSKDDNITALKASLGISVASTGIGYGASKLLTVADGTKYEGVVRRSIDVAGDWKTYTALVAGMGSIALIKKLHNSNSSKEDIPSEDILLDTDKDGTGYYFISDKKSDCFKDVLRFEQDIWNEKGYGSLEEYNDKYLNQTRFFAAFEGDECVATVRVFSKGKELPPLLSAMSFYSEDDMKTFTEQNRNGITEELATSASKNDTKHRAIVNNLWRLAGRDAMTRGVKNWGIIMEPKRVKALNRFYNFYFFQKGPEVEYQGGMCAPHIMDLDYAVQAMERDNSKLLKWFINEPLKP